MHSETVEPGSQPRRAAADAAGTRPTLSFAAVNGWRGPGSLAIAFAHFALLTDYFSYHRLEPIALLVDLFFVLSGLMIAQAYANTLRDPSAIPEYIIRRFGRIWPVQAALLVLLVIYELIKFAAVHWFGAHPTLAPFAVDGPNALASIPTNLLLLHALGLHARETWNFPSWSLSVEFVTYVVFALTCLLRPRHRYVLSFVMLLASLAILIFLAPYRMRSTYDFGIFRCFAGFFAGTLCYELLVRYRLPKWPFPTLVEIVTLAGIGLWLAAASGGYVAFAAPFVFCGFVVIFVAGRGALSRLLSTRLFQTLAEWSFAIYMVHAIVLLFSIGLLRVLARRIEIGHFAWIPNEFARSLGIDATIEVFHPAQPALLLPMGLVYGASVLLSAYLAYRLIEVPGRGIFGKLAKLTRRGSKRGSVENPIVASSA